MPDSSEIKSRRSDFGSVLVERGALTSEAYARALRSQAESGEALSGVLTKLGLISERTLAEAFSAYLQLPIAALKDFPTAPVLDEKISVKFLKWARLIPLAADDNEIIVAMADPLDDENAEALNFALRKKIIRRVALFSDIDAAYERLYGSKDRVDQNADAIDELGASDDVERLRDLASEAPVIRLVNQFIDRAVEARASDIHIEPTAHGLRVRFRVDGVLQEIDPPSAHLRAAIVSRIKIMAKLNIAERRLAQDGRIRVATRGTEIDLRVATSPTLHGESVVLRILDRGSLALDFAALGFDDDVLTPFIDILQKPHGILLVTGPTGSGKTTTLYTSLLTLNTIDKKILTIEDPIEYQLDGVNQHQVKPQVGLTFAASLRSFLRQDPDIMMVGEIRDLETAQIAIQAALTGHMLLSTLHTNSAASAVTRLLDMGVEDYLLTSTVNAILGQRLVRCLCVHCKEMYHPDSALMERLQLAEDDHHLYRPVGCDHCNGTGYLGRTMILELLPLTDEIRSLVLRHAEAREVEQVAVAQGMRTMNQHGFAKALAGITSMDEVFRVTRDT